jgi:hypothetical protein
MTPLEAAEKARAIVKGGDTEIVHYELDELLLKVAGRAGYGELVEIFVEAEKWYA